MQVCFEYNNLVIKDFHFQNFGVRGYFAYFFLYTINPYKKAWVE